jgi:hypothetical protein
MQANRSRDLTGTTFQLLALAALIVTSFWIVRPFLMALAWATMIAVATWPLLLHAQAWLGGRRALAVTVMTMALLLVLVVPLYFGITAIVENAKRIAASHPDLGERFLSCEGTAPFAVHRERDQHRASLPHAQPDARREGRHQQLHRPRPAGCGESGKTGNEGVSALPDHDRGRGIEDVPDASRWLQLMLMLEDSYMHPSGQIPAYEWNFSDVNPPVHAWATNFTYAIEMLRHGKGDIDWFEASFHKLALNFTWWVNRKDRAGNNAFEGGFLGLDNIGVEVELAKGGPSGGTARRRKR